MECWFCLVCFEENADKLRCECGAESYCSTNCQRQHWSTHREYCVLRRVRKHIRTATGGVLGLDIERKIEKYMIKTLKPKTK